MARDRVIKRLDVARVGDGKTPGFALLLRFYAEHGRFPAGRSEIPDQAVAHVAWLVDVPAAELGFYEWDGRTIKAHRADIRKYFGFRECSVAGRSQGGGVAGRERVREGAPGRPSP